MKYRWPVHRQPSHRIYGVFHEIPPAKLRNRLRSFHETACFRFYGAFHELSPPQNWKWMVSWNSQGGVSGHAFAMLVSILKSTMDRPSLCNHLCSLGDCYLVPHCTFHKLIGFSLMPVFGAFSHLFLLHRIDLTRCLFWFRETTILPYSTDSDWSLFLGPVLYIFSFN